jgi:hypothetical protein
MQVLQSKRPPAVLEARGYKKCVLKNHKTVMRMRHAQYVPTVPPLIWT